MNKIAHCYDIIGIDVDAYNIGGIAYPVYSFKNTGIRVGLNEYCAGFSVSLQGSKAAPYLCIGVPVADTEHKTCFGTRSNQIKIERSFIGVADVFDTAGNGR